MSLKTIGVAVPTAEAVKYELIRRVGEQLSALMNKISVELIESIAA